VKVKIFSGMDKGQVEDQINAWLVSTKPTPKVRKSDTSIKQVSIPHTSAKGTKMVKRPVMFANVWYD
jgi:hypothetical protein